MRIYVHTSRSYKDEVTNFIEGLKDAVAPVTIGGKEYVAVVKNEGAWILRINIGGATYFEEGDIFAAIANESVMVIGLILAGSGNVQNMVHELICAYWEKMRMRADKEAALMYRTPKEQQEIAVI